MAQNSGPEKSLGGFFSVQVADELKSATETNPENAVGWKRRRLAGGAWQGVAPDPEQAVRHRAFLQRGQNKGTTSHRPKKVDRVSAKKWIVALDNQIRVSSPEHVKGLIFYKYQASSPEWSEEAWRTWPHCGVALDLGPDGMCAMMALLYYFGLNLTKFPDFDHACQRAVLEMLRESGLMDFMMLMMVALNVPQGPDNNDQRYKQNQEAGDKLLNTQDARSCVPLSSFH